MPISGLTGGAGSSSSNNKLVIVANEIARFALTKGSATNQVQLWDSVLQTDTQQLYFVINTSLLNVSGGYYAYPTPTKQVLASVFIACGTNIALTGSVTYGGLKIPTTSRVLAYGQTDGTKNGIYVSNDGGAWVRTTDADTMAKLYNSNTSALNGDIGSYDCTNLSTDVVGSSNITFINIFAQNNPQGIRPYNVAQVYSIGDLTTYGDYIWKAILDPLNPAFVIVGVTPDMSAPNWEIYQGLLFQNSAVVAPNGNDLKSVGFPYLTYTGAIVDLNANAYIEGRAITNTETITPKAGMKIQGDKAQVNNLILNVNNTIIDGMYFANTIGTANPIQINAVTNSTFRNVRADKLGGTQSISVTGAWGGVHIFENMELTGNINITGTTTSGEIYFSDCNSILTLTLNCANAKVYISNCPNFTTVQTLGTIVIGDVKKADKVPSELAVANLPVGGSIGAAPGTVDIYETFKISQTTALQTITIPTPTVTTNKKYITVENSGTVAFTVLDVNISIGAFIWLLYNGTAWITAISSDDNTPIGKIEYFANTVNFDKRLVLNAQAVSRTTYSKLFSLWGTLYGIGDGTTTFNVPDMRDKVLGMAGTLHAPGTFAGTETTTGIVNHTHTLVHTHPIDHDHSSFVSGNGGTASVNNGDYGLIRRSAGGQNTVADTDTTAGEPDLISAPGGWAHTHPIDIPAFSGLSGAASTSTTSTAGTGTSVSLLQPTGYIGSWYVYAGA